MKGYVVINYHYIFIASTILVLKNILAKTIQLLSVNDGKICWQWSNAGRRENRNSKYCNEVILNGITLFVLEIRYYCMKDSRLVMAVMWDGWNAIVEFKIIRFRFVEKICFRCLSFPYFLLYKAVNWKRGLRGIKLGQGLRGKNIICLTSVKLHSLTKDEHF